MSTSAAALQPLYLKVKRHILDNIDSGKWGTSARVPSENEIVKSFGVSRMTANRALQANCATKAFWCASRGSAVSSRTAMRARIRSRSAASPMRSASAATCTAPKSSRSSACAPPRSSPRTSASRRAASSICSLIVHFENDRPGSARGPLRLAEARARLSDRGFQRAPRPTTI